MAKTQSPQKDSAPKTVSRGTVILMLGTLVSTTWRMFVPTLGGLAIGLWLDTYYGTGPWFMVAGIFVGSWLAVYFIYRQLKALKK